MINVNVPTKAGLDRVLTLSANEAANCLLKWHEVYTQISGMVDADLTALGYNANDIYAIRAYGTALENLYRHYTGQSLLDNSVPQAYVTPLVQVQY